MSDDWETHERDGHIVAATDPRWFDPAIPRRDVGAILSARDSQWFDGAPKRVGHQSPEFERIQKWARAETEEDRPRYHYYDKDKWFAALRERGKCVSCDEEIDKDRIARCHQQNKPTPFYCEKCRVAKNKAMKRKRDGQDVRTITVSGIYQREERIQREPAKPGTPAWIEAEIQRRRREKAKRLDPGEELLANKARDPVAQTRYEQWLEHRHLEWLADYGRFQYRAEYFRNLEPDYASQLEGDVAVNPSGGRDDIA